jgi:hypothetical protein
MAESPGVTQRRSATLEDAWQRFARYDRNAGIAQKRFIWQRKLILALGVAATVVAVFYSELEKWSALSADEIAENPLWLQGAANWIVQHDESLLRPLHAVVVVIPIVISVLVAGTVKFNMGVSWVMLRSSAEALKKEIYRYRTQVDEYCFDSTHSNTRDVELARKLKVISKRLMETQVNQTGLEPYQGELPPPNCVAPGDDGFGDLTAEQYMKHRVEDQFDYYQRKAVQRTNELQRFQWLIYILGGLGTLLAAFRFDVWIAVVGAIATAFTSFLEFKRVESTIVSFNMAATDLYDIRTWWRALSDTARTQQRNIETLVNSTEAVIQTENAGWLQEMRDALSEIYGRKKDEEAAPAAASPDQPIAPLPERISPAPDGSVTPATDYPAPAAAVDAQTHSQQTHSQTPEGVV